MEEGLAEDLLFSSVRPEPRPQVPFQYVFFFVKQGGVSLPASLIPKVTSR